ncbi:MAG TPA: hypothetical protein H9881_06965 [Candidatus Stackebrandtia excrementipullorum]|nr:hypothetical protein [Candidatus Stackebrandtia excrementipullorum]
MTGHSQNVSSSRTTNTAQAGATVGIQASEVHHATIYQVYPQSSPREKYEVGRSYLADGVPSMAEQLISEAIAGGYNSAEVRFHWLLAMLSKRSYRDLSRRERDRLTEFARDRYPYPDSDYRAGVEAGQELVSHLSGLGGDVDAAEKKILALPAELRAMTDRHLSFVLSGATRDKLWETAKERAAAERMSDNRANRMWAYFHPKPARPRLAEIDPPQITVSDRRKATVSTGLFGLSAAYISWLTITNAAFLPIVALVCAVPAALIGLHHASECHYRMFKMDLEERRRRSGFARRPKGDGFAHRLFNDFERYFFKYRPNNVTADAWLAETEAIRGHLHGELSRTYRESRTDAARVRWLIGFLAQDVRQRWLDGSLHDHRVRYQLTWPPVLRVLLGLGMLLVCTVAIFNEIFHMGDLLAWPAMLCMIVAGPYAASRAQHIIAQKRLFVDDEAEAREELDKRMVAYHRWKEKLERARPSENNMETWLHSDKTKLLDEALRHYRLSWRDVIAYAVLQGPGKNRQRARVQGGPWRYSVYRLRYFLITTEGVREVYTELDFKTSMFKEQERNNYRFEAVSSVNVTENGYRRSLKLTLTNGPTRKIHITEADMGENDPFITSSAQMARLNLNAAGFTHALPILEGIAAEGKGWLEGGNNSFPGAH